MSDPTIERLAANPAGVDQIDRAREICGSSAERVAKLDAFLSTQPNRGQMIDFIEDLKQEGLREAMEANIQRILKSAGIDTPTGTDKLLAMQIGLLQEQNEALNVLAGMTSRVAANTKDKPAIFGPVLGAVLLGKIL
ncbi:hypothetical protein [Burkholderia ubonensis]|uniref:hypothetical protein n=1 Tax=Burkholderia ubonensis TaxID=101571 RepID=UPI00075EF9BA|nr:hypothetical protein [Burkholderia ubonensis]KWE97881.1 hypothetical protein WL81_02290 [Burkholderia ubonensis]